MNWYQCIPLLRSLEMTLNPIVHRFDAINFFSLVSFLRFFIFARKTSNSKKKRLTQQIFIKISFHAMKFLFKIIKPVWWPICAPMPAHELWTLAVWSIFFYSSIIIRNFIFAYFKSKQQTLALRFTYHNCSARNPMFDSLKPQNRTSWMYFMRSEWKENVRCVSSAPRFLFSNKNK